MLEPYVHPGIDDRPDLDKALSPEDKDAVARLAIKDRRRPPEASADQPEAQAVRLAAAGSSAAAAAAASVDAPAPDLSSAYLDMRDPMVAANGQRPTAVQISRLNWGFFVASILVGAPWAALNTIAMPNAVARLFDYDTASAISVTINPSTGRPLPVATDLVMPLAVLVVVGVVASMFAMPLVSALSDRTRIPLGRRTPWMVAGGVLCALITLVLGQNTGLVVLCFFWALMQFAYAMISVPLARSQVFDQLRPPAHAPAFARVFAARVCMMTGVGLTGVFLWYLVRFWVYGKAVVFTSAPLTIPAGLLIAGMAAATLIGAALASWAAGPISEKIEERNIATTAVVAASCLLYAIGVAVAWGLGVWSTGTARENGMLLFALISGFAFGVYDALGLELVVNALPDPRNAGHDLGIYALANSVGLALAAIIGAVLVSAFASSFGYYLLFPSAIVMVFLAGIITLSSKAE